MTIDEAISHALEVAGEQQERADSAELIDILDGLDVRCICLFQVFRDQYQNIFEVR